MKWFHFVMLAAGSGLAAGMVDAHINRAENAHKVVARPAAISQPADTLDRPAPPTTVTTYQAPLALAEVTPTPAAPIDAAARRGLPPAETIRAMLDCRDAATVVPMMYTGIDSANYDLRLRPMEWVVQNKYFGGMLVYNRSAGVPDDEKVAMFGESITARLKERREAEARVSTLVAANPELAALPASGEDAVHSPRLAPLRLATGYDSPVGSPPLMVVQRGFGDPGGNEPEKVVVSDSPPSIIGTVYGLDMAAALLGDLQSPHGVAPLIRLADAERRDAAENPFRRDAAAMPGVGMWVDSHWDLASLGLVADSLDRIMVKQPGQASAEYKTWRIDQELMKRSNAMIGQVLPWMSGVVMRDGERVGFMGGRELMPRGPRYEMPIPWEESARNNSLPLTDVQVAYIIDFARTHAW